MKVQNLVPAMSAELEMFILSDGSILSLYFSIVLFIKSFLFKLSWIGVAVKLLLCVNNSGATIFMTANWLFIGGDSTHQAFYSSFMYNISLNSRNRTKISLSQTEMKKNMGRFQTTTS